MAASRWSGTAGIVALIAAAYPLAAETVVWTGSVEIAVGGGEKGPWRQNASRYDYVDDPTVALDARGDAFVAWVAQDSKDVLFLRLSGDRTPAEPTNVSRSARTFSWLPRIALAPDAADRFYVLWQEIIFSGGSHGGDILFARSDDGGRTFTAPANLSRSIGGDGKGRITRDVWHNGSLDIAAGAGGMVYAVWTEYDGPLWFVRSLDGGETFTQPRQIDRGGDQRPARAPALALGANGTVFLAWTVGNDDDAGIHVAVSENGGTTFGAARTVERSKGYSDAPKLAVGKDGVLHLVYAHGVSGPFGRFHVRYARSRDGGRTFAASREVSTPMPPGYVGARFPSLAADARGNVAVTWELYPSHRSGPQGLGVVVSRDGGTRFTAPDVVPGSRDPAGGTNGSQQGRLMRKLALNVAGDIAIVNSSLKPNNGSRVWLIHGRLE